MTSRLPSLSFAAHLRWILGLSLGLGFLPLSPALAFVGEDDQVLERSIVELGMPPEQAPDLDASYAALMDEDGTLWFGRGADERAQIASLTKIMTALVVVEHLDAAATIVVTPEAASIGESSAGLVQGDAMTFDDALKALLTASGNDAASAIAQTAGAAMLAERGLDGDAATCEATFVDGMNSKAAELGLDNSFFTNPHGLDFDAYAQGQYSCAADVAAMLRTAMSYDLIRSNIGYSQVNIVVARNGGQTTLTLNNTDALLNGYEGTCAAKTGYTLAAGPCAAAAATRDDGHEYYAVVLGSSSKAQRFADEETLYDWIYARRAALSPLAQTETTASPEPPAETETYQLINAVRSTTVEIAGETATYPVVAEAAHGDWTDRTVAATVLDANATATVSVGSGLIEQEATFAALSGDVERGDVVGRLTFRQGDEVLWEGDLVAAADVAAPTWWENLGVRAQRFLGGLVGAPTSAESKLVALGPLKVS